MPSAKTANFAFLLLFLLYFLDQNFQIEGSIIDFRINKLRLSETSLENMKRLHYNWYLFSVKALIAQMSKSLLLLLDPKTKSQFLRCLAKIPEVREIEKSARCLVDAKNKWNSSLASKRRDKRSPHRLIMPGYLDKIKSYAHAPPLKSTSQPVKSVTKLFTTLFTNISYLDLPRNWERAFKKMKKIQRNLEKQEKSKSSHVYKYRMLDLVLERTRKNTNPDPWENLFALANSFGTKDTNLNVLSPRLMPVMPSSKGKRGLLSPALFPLYRDEKEDQILPIPTMLDKWGMSESDRNSILQMIMEVTGARQTVEDAINVLESFNTMGIGSAIFKATGKLSKTFEKLKSSFDPIQKKALKKKGFVILDSKQMKRLHDDVGITGKQKEIDYDQYAKLNRKERRQVLWKIIERLATKPRRRKRAIISFLAPTVLAPYMFSPVTGISIIGPVVLSPNIFSPLILNPSVLGPWVLSPSVPLPFILSPYLLSPYVLSPLVMAPFVLSPYVVSPNVINPYVLAPVILSPVVLSPDVISPMVLAGPILSPGVLSPSVLSKSALMATVLSPTVLS